MSLKNSSLLAMIAVIFTMIRNAYFTFNHTYVASVGMIDMVFSLTAGIFMIIFYLSLLKNVIDSDQNQLMNSCIGVITISTGLLIINFINDLGIYINSFWINDATFKYLKILVNWLHAIILTYFFVYFYIDNKKSSAYFTKSGVIGFIGSTAFLLIESVKLLNYFYYIDNKTEFFGKSSPLALPVGIFLIMTGFIFWFMFIYRFYRKKH